MSSFTSISQEDAWNMMEEGNVTIVDVRRDFEYNAGHVPNAILIPVETIDTARPIELPNVDATILVYCRSGSRSKMASQKLADMGYKNIYEFGGIITWPYEIV